MIVVCYDCDTNFYVDDRVLTARNGWAVLEKEVTCPKGHVHAPQTALEVARGRVIRGDGNVIGDNSKSRVTKYPDKYE